MEFFDKIGKKASQTYKYTQEKTSKLAKEAKLKMTMNENKSKIEEIYNEIGKKVYMNHINKDDIDVDLEAILEEYCIQIDEICDAIEDERTELLTLKEKKQCPNCFAEIQMHCNYCPNCGYEQEHIETEDNIEQENELTKQENIDTENEDN